jgi:hypothetical protein
MLLHPGLQDDDIPHRDKLREAIIDEWFKWFDGLKQELEVCHMSQVCVWLLTNSFDSERSRPDQLYSRYMVFWVTFFVSRPHCPLDL